MTKEELIRRIDDLEWEDFEVKEARANSQRIFGRQSVLLPTHRGDGLCLVLKKLERNSKFVVLIIKIS